MKKLEFERDGQPFRVYLDRSGAVFVDVKDLYLSDKPFRAAGYEVDEGFVEDILEDHPASRIIAGRPVWEESLFFHIWLDEMAADETAFFYLCTVLPKVRQEVMIMAESDWQESDKVRQLEEDLRMNLGERRKAEASLAASLDAYDVLLKHFVRVCTDNGVMSRLLAEISGKTRDKEIRARIADVLERNSRNESDRSDRKNQGENR